MNLSDWQKIVDKWINEYGIRYYDEMTNTVILFEECGELARLMARKYGEQSFKNDITQEEIVEKIEEEIADIFFVLTCLSNQMNIDLTEILDRNITKKSSRDKNRHYNNKKLQ
jgi:NTP pyrophosphatase (non-canonical NTP hydrolase)